MTQFHVLFRACDKIESAHGATRPFGLNKTQVIQLSFYSVYQALQRHQARFTVIGDDLSTQLLSFFKRFDNVTVLNVQLGSAAASLQKQIELALQVPDERWVYLLEDDYLHVPSSFDVIAEFIENKSQYIATSGKKKNYMNRLLGNLKNMPVIIHPPDYPDRYLPEWKRLSYIFLSRHCHWRQISNTTHTLLLQSKTVKQFRKQIEASAVGPSDSKLSEKVYARLRFKHRALCLSPIKGLSTHMTEGVMTPLVNWQVVAQQVIQQMQQAGFDMPSLACNEEKETELLTVSG